MSNELWQPGDHVLLRDVVGGRGVRRHVRSAVPCTVVEHTSARLALFVCPGTTFMLPDDWDRKESRDFFVAPGHVALEYASPGRLVLMEPRARHSVLVGWTPEWEFTGWYINLQAPMQRSESGIDITDQMLDVVVSPDGLSIEWKDLEEFERAIAEGFFTAEEAEAIRVEGERVLARARERGAPFDEPWPEWWPDPARGIPRLPEGWATVV